MATSSMIYVDVVRALADHGADINTPTHYGLTPVCIAAQEGHVDVAGMGKMYNILVFSV